MISHFKNQARLNVRGIKNRDGQIIHQEDAANLSFRNRELIVQKVASFERELHHIEDINEKKIKSLSASHERKLQHEKMLHEMQTAHFKYL